MKKTLLFVSTTTTFVPNIGDKYIDMDEIEWLVVGRTFLHDGRLLIHIERITL